MKHLLPILILLVGVRGFAATETYDIDSAHSVAAFKVRHMMVSWVHGHFSGMTGTVTLDDKDLKKMTADVTIDASTVTTNHQKRDEHLKSADFFNVSEHKNLTFKTKKVIPGKKGTFKLVGDLTLVGKTKEVTFEGKDLTKAVKDPWGGTRRGLTATTRLNRKDWGLTWNKALEAGGVVVGDQVDVTVELELMAKPKEEKKG